MSRLLIFTVGLLFSVSSFCEDLSVRRFHERFSLVKDQEGKVKIIKLKKVIRKFTLRPFLEQIKQDLLNEQQSFMGLSSYEKEAEIDQMLLDLGLNPYLKSQGEDEAGVIKRALLNLPNINVDEMFRALGKGGFWQEFERRLNEAFLFIDPTILANLEDSRFFYRRNVTYKVVEWALQQVQKRFSNVPVLNSALFVIVRVHEMMLEQRYFHHNMLLHYFETIPETKLGMTKEEVDRAVSSIYEYRIAPVNYPESNRAAQDWLNFGINQFYRMVRAGNGRILEWKAPLSRMSFKDVSKLNFGFASVVHEGSRKIYHLHHSAHQFSRKPSLAFDYSKPNKVKRIRTLLNIAQVTLGFITIPGQLKGVINNFIKSIYVEQVRMEGGLVGYFESTGDTSMIDHIYNQRANFYILR